MNKSPLYAAVLIASLFVIPTAKGAQHFWELQEIYTNSSGTLQFIELFEPFAGEQFVGGFDVEIVNIGATQTNTFTIPTNLPNSPSTAGRTFLLGTAGIQAAGGPAPDYIIPDNFLFIAGGTINYFGVDSGGMYTALPTDGLMSRTWGGGNAVNTPKNFAGQVGMVPEPTTLMLCAGSGACLFLFALRRRAACLKSSV
jgi:hypothetical protein